MPRLKEYHRPATVEEALQLLSRAEVTTAVLAGGAHLTPRLAESVDEVVDLQAAGLTEVAYTEKIVTLGAMVRLQAIVEDDKAPPLLREAAHREGPNTTRNAATIGGAVVTAEPNSELLAALLVFEATVEIHTLDTTRTAPLADFLLDPQSALKGGLVTAVSLATTGKTATARVGRTPADRPIVAAVGRLTDKGKIRLALCGVAERPILVDPSIVKAAVNPPGDFRGSSAYRRQMAAVMAQRVITELSREQ